jgi:hypothetical protein
VCVCVCVLVLLDVGYALAMVRSVIAFTEAGLFGYYFADICEGVL